MKKTLLAVLIIFLLALLITAAIYMSLPKFPQSDVQTIPVSGSTGAQQSTDSQVNASLPSSPGSGNDTVQKTGTPSGCRINGNLQDKVCTPGVANPKVTQSNIHETICVSGFTKTIRPPVSYTEPLKIKQIKLYGYSDTRLSSYEEDHLIPLEVGGDPADPKNLWPEPIDQAHEKDRVENFLNKQVCDGNLSLMEAQREISTDWFAVYKTL